MPPITFGTPTSEFHERTFQFAINIVQFCRRLAGEDDTWRTLGRQLQRAGTGIGANMEEAKAAYSRRDFAAKLSISLREARETVYWLRLVAAVSPRQADFTRDLGREANEFVAILTASLKRTRATLALQATLCLCGATVLLSAYSVLLISYL
jgi:four helix bundle protein